MREVEEQDGTKGCQLEVPNMLRLSVMPMSMAELLQDQSITLPSVALVKRRDACCAMDYGIDETESKCDSRCVRTEESSSSRARLYPRREKMADIPGARA